MATPTPTPTPTPSSCTTSPPPSASTGAAASSASSAPPSSPPPPTAAASGRGTSRSTPEPRSSPRGSTSPATSPPPRGSPSSSTSTAAASSSSRPSSPTYHRYVASLAARARVLVVSVDYRRAPEHPLPAAYDDAQAALRWAAAADDADADPWIAAHGDRAWIFLGGDSAGGKIAHNVAMRGRGWKGWCSSTPASGERTGGGGGHGGRVQGEDGGDVVVLCPGAAGGLGDPRVDPTAEGAPGLQGLGCRRLMVCVAEKDVLRERGRVYCQKVRGSGWGGDAAEMVESEGEGHVFFLRDPDGHKARQLMDRVAAFFKPR